MAKRDVVELEGTVLDALPNAMLRVELENGYGTLVHVSGKVRINYTCTLPGGKITVEMSPYDLIHGRITYRCK